MTQKECMLNGDLFFPNDDDLKKDRKKVQQILQVFNLLMPFETKKRFDTISKIVYKIGTNSSVYPPFYCDYGYNIIIGEHSFINVNCVILDVNNVMIGNNVLIGPNVTITSATHPINKTQREKGYVYGLPIVINDNVWLGAGSIINPGVTIGKNAIIGSGSIVTTDIPPNVIAVGNPCRIKEKIESEEYL